MSEAKRYPIVAAGAFIFNDKNELLLVKAPRWFNTYTCIGGKIEIGETVIDALKREVKEESNLEIEDPQLINIVDGLNIEKENNNDYKHLIFINFRVKAVNPEDLILDEEATSYRWMPVDKWLNKDRTKFTHYIYETLEKLNREPNESSDIKENFENKYIRALADYQNLLKQTAKEKSDFAKYANQNLLHDIIPAYDNLKIAASHADEKNHDSWLEGVKYVIKQFKDALEQNGIEEIKTAGEKFDHNTMDAVHSEETEDKKLDGKVAKEIKAGYMLNGKVIIPARVVVYKFNH